MHKYSLVKRLYERESADHSAPKIPPSATSDNLCVYGLHKIISILKPVVSRITNVEST